MTADELIDLGLSHQQAGRNAQAIDSYRRALVLDADNADALNLLGTALQATGDFTAAVPPHRRAVELVEDEASFHSNFARALLETGELDAAAHHFQRAAELDESAADVWMHVGVIRQRQGRHSEAVAAFSRLANVRPTDATVLNNLGAALRFAGRSAEAVEPLRLAVKLDPKSSMARDNLVRALHEAHRIPESIDDVAALVALAPDNPVALSLQAITLNSSQRYLEAMEITRQAIKRFPDELELHFQLAVSFQMVGEFAPALIALRRCLELQPENLRVVVRLGWVMFLIGQPREARDVFVEASRLKEDDLEVWVNLSIAAQAISEYTQATEAARKALEIAPNSAPAVIQLISCLLKEGKHEEVDRELDRAAETVGEHPLLLIQRGAIAGERGLSRVAVDYFRRAGELDPSLHHTAALVAMFHNYLDDVTPEQTFAAHVHWGNQYDNIIRKSARTPERFDVTPERDRRLRVGLVSPDFRGHSCAFFALPIFKHLDRKQFELVCFDNTRTLDKMSSAMHGLADEWHRVVGISDEAVADLIRKQRIDVLVDLAGLTADSRIISLAYRPAPVQFTYLGYPNTTGLRTVDYRLVDSITDPPGTADDLCVEKLVRLDPIFLSYQPQEAPDVAPEPPSRAAGHITFGSFNNFMKASDSTVRMWCDVLKRLPGSRLIIKSNGLGDLVTRARAAARFEAFGIAVDRLEFVSRLPNMLDHLALYSRIDVAMDMYPYSGTTTTCECLWMGVPTITRIGQVHASRVSATILHAVGHPEWIAEDEAAFIEKAVALALDDHRRAEIRSTLREQMRVSPLMDHAGFCRRFETAIRNGWREWCDSII